MGTDETPDRTIFRRRRSRFTAVGNAPLQDNRLSLDSVGFLVCILSLPENWVFNRTWAKRRFNLGKERLSRIISELEACGYVVRKQEREADGRHGQVVYTFTDEPGEFGDVPPEGGEIPRPGEPRAGFPPTANQPYIKDYPLPKTSNLKKATPPAEPADEPEVDAARARQVRELVASAGRGVKFYPKRRHVATPEELRIFAAMAEGRTDV